MVINTLRFSFCKFHYSFLCLPNNTRLYILKAFGVHCSTVNRALYFGKWGINCGFCVLESMEHSCFEYLVFIDNELHYLLMACITS